MTQGIAATPAKGGKGRAGPDLLYRLPLEKRPSGGADLRVRPLWVLTATWFRTATARKSLARTRKPAHSLGVFLTGEAI